MKEKISLFVSNLEGGGAERVMVTLANQFNEMGYSVDLVLVQARGPYLKDVQSQVNIVSLNASKNMFSLVPFIRYLRKERPKAILSTLLVINIVTVVAKWLSGVQTRVVLREAINASADINSKKGQLERYLGAMRRWALKGADAIVAPSFGVKSDLVKTFRIDSNRVKVIYNPVDIDKIRNLSVNPDKFLESLDLGRPIVLAIGRLNGQKDFSALIESFELISTQCNALLVILGEGELRRSLEELISHKGLSDRVYLPGFVANPFTFMKRADVFVLSSLYEGMPNALIQATVFNKQIVSTDCPSGPSEILENGKYGCLVEIGDIDGMAQGILKGLSGSLTTLSSEKVKGSYEASEIAKKYIEVLLV